MYSLFSPLPSSITIMYQPGIGFEEEDLELYGGVAGPSLERQGEGDYDGTANPYNTSAAGNASQELANGSSFEEEEEGEGDDGGAPRVLSRTALATYMKRHSLIDIGHDAAWSVSTAKHGNGVEMLMDGSPETYWQSDGGHPHTITIRFPKLTLLAGVGVLLNHNADESYTPKCVLCVYGTHERDGQELVANVYRPNGWLIIEPPQEAKGSCFAGAQPQGAAGSWGAPVLLQDEAGSTMTVFPSRLGELLPRTSPMHFSASDLCGVWVNYVNIVIEENHDDGRDTHVRGVRLFTAVHPWSTFQTKRFFSEDTIR